MWKTAAVSDVNLFHGICEIDLAFKLGVSVTRGNSCKLVKTSCNTNAAKYFYTNRIVEEFSSDSVVSVFATCARAYTPCFKKTSTHIIGYKLRNSCPILIIFDIKIPHIM